MEPGTQAPAATKALIQVCGLWKSENKNGKYIAGSAGALRYYIFPNRKKRKPEEPDFQLVIGQRQREKKKEDFIDQEPDAFQGLDDETETQEKTPNPDTGEDTEA